DSGPLLPEAGLRRESAKVGPGGGAPCRCRIRGDCFWLRSGAERLLLAARRGWRERCDGTAGASVARTRSLSVAEQGAAAAPRLSLLVPEVLARRDSRVGNAGCRPDCTHSLGTRAPLPPNWRPRAGCRGLAHDRAGCPGLLRRFRRSSR